MTSVMYKVIFVLLCVLISSIQAQRCVCELAQDREGVALFNIKVNANLYISQIKANVGPSNCTVGLSLPNGTRCIVHHRTTNPPEETWFFKGPFLYFRSSSGIPPVGEYQIHFGNRTWHFYQLLSIEPTDTQPEIEVFTPNFTITPISPQLKTCLQANDYDWALNISGSRTRSTPTCNSSNETRYKCWVEQAEQYKSLQVFVSPWRDSERYIITCTYSSKSKAQLRFRLATSHWPASLGISLVLALGLTGLIGTIVCVWKQTNIGPKDMKDLHIANNLISIDSMENNPYFQDIVLDDEDWPKWILAADDLLRVPIETITKDDILGEGHFGVVYNGQVKIQSLSCPVAIKELISAVDQEEILHEAKKLWQVRDHPHIVSLQCLSKFPCGDSFRYVLVMSLESKMNLSKYLRTHRAQLGFREEKLIGWMHQVADGLAFLAKHDIIHFDLAARNILLTTESEIAKISDLGLAKFASEIPDLNMRRGDLKLPLDRIPLEVFHDLSRASDLTDIWSFGILLWEVFSFGERPYDQEFHRHTDPGHPYSRITSAQIVQSASDSRFNFIHEFLSSGKRLSSPFQGRSTFLPFHQDLYAIMLKCWSPKPLDRPRAWVLRDQLKVFMSAKDKTRQAQVVSQEKSGYLDMKREMIEVARRSRNLTA